MVGNEGDSGSTDPSSPANGQSWYLTKEGVKERREQFWVRLGVERSTLLERTMLGEGVPAIGNGKVELRALFRGHPNSKEALAAILSYQNTPDAMARVGLHMVQGLSRALWKTGALQQGTVPALAETFGDESVHGVISSHSGQEELESLIDAVEIAVVSTGNTGLGKRVAQVAKDYTGQLFAVLAQSLNEALSSEEWDEVRTGPNSSKHSTKDFGVRGVRESYEGFVRTLVDALSNPYVQLRREQLAGKAKEGYIKALVRAVSVTRSSETGQKVTDLAGFYKDSRVAESVMKTIERITWEENPADGVNTALEALASPELHRSSLFSGYSNAGAYIPSPMLETVFEVMAKLGSGTEEAVRTRGALLRFCFEEAARLQNVTKALEAAGSSNPYAAIRAVVEAQQPNMAARR